MTNRIFIIAVMLCVCFISYAQIEQASQKLAETQHKQFASDLSSSLKLGKSKPIFSKQGNDKQFLLMDEEPFFTEYLGWKKTQFARRDLLSVYQALLTATKQKDAKKKVSVKITFPLDETTFQGPATNKGRAIKDVYVVTTTAAVLVEASKVGAMTSFARNNLTLSWDVAVSINKKTGAVDTRASRAILKSIFVERVPGFFPAEQQQMREVTEKLIKDYYQSLKDAKWSAVEIPDEWKSPLQASVKRETEGDIVMYLPNSTFFDVNTVPTLNIYVNSEEYHKVALGFSIDIDDDLKSGRIISVSYTELEKPQIVALEPVIEPEPVIKPEPIAQPVVRERGITYKVQILSLFKPISTDDLPQRFRIDHVVIEKYVVDGVTYYKYMIPVGATLSEAFAVRRQMRNNGIEDAWIVVYEDGARISPNEGMPEPVR